MSIIVPVHHRSRLIARHVKPLSVSQRPAPPVPRFKGSLLDTAEIKQRDMNAALDFARRATSFKDAEELVQALMVNHPRQRTLEEVFELGYEYHTEPNFKKQLKAVVDGSPLTLYRMLVKRGLLNRPLSELIVQQYKRASFFRPLSPNREDALRTVLDLFYVTYMDGEKTLRPLPKPKADPKRPWMDERLLGIEQRVRLAALQSEARLQLNHSNTEKAMRFIQALIQSVPELDRLYHTGSTGTRP